MSALRPGTPISEDAKLVERREEATFNRIHRLIFRVGFTIFGIYELLKFIKHLYLLW